MYRDKEGCSNTIFIKGRDLEGVRSIIYLFLRNI
jgi:hypothetical protein